MTTAAHLGALYAAAPIVLWVEDAVTRDYLSKVWADAPEIAFLIGGGNQAIATTVLAAEREGIPHVFGLVDRDFGMSNQATWGAAATRVYRLPKHEVENYALEADAVGGCGLNNRGRTVAQVRAELARLAGLQPAWLACRRVISEIRSDFQRDFPPHPVVAAIPAVVDAVQYITGQPWFADLPVRTAGWQTPGRVAAACAAAEQAAQAALGSGAWAVEFSGKEVFRQLRGYVYQPPQNPGYPDSDFAKAVGEWQQANNRVPPDLAGLRSALRVKVGLPP